MKGMKDLLPEHVREDVTNLCLQLWCDWVCVYVYICDCVSLPVIMSL